MKNYNIIEQIEKKDFQYNEDDSVYNNAGGIRLYFATGDKGK